MSKVHRVRFIPLRGGDLVTREDLAYSDPRVPRLHTLRVLTGLSPCKPDEHCRICGAS